MRKRIKPESVAILFLSGFSS